MAYNGPREPGTRDRRTAGSWWRRPVDLRLHRPPTRSTAGRPIRRSSGRGWEALATGGYLAGADGDEQSTAELREEETSRADPSGAAPDASRENCASMKVPAMARATDHVENDVRVANDVDRGHRDHHGRRGSAPSTRTVPWTRGRGWRLTPRQRRGRCGRIRPPLLLRAGGIQAQRARLDGDYGKRSSPGRPRSAVGRSWSCSSKLIDTKLESTLWLMAATHTAGTRNARPRGAAPHRRPRGR